jgi:hypothetical protein
MDESIHLWQAPTALLSTRQIKVYRFYASDSE